MIHWIQTHELVYIFILWATFPLIVLGCMIGIGLVLAILNLPMVLFLYLIDCIKLKREDKNGTPL